jgi:hypothetical protein
MSMGQFLILLSDIFLKAKQQPAGCQGSISLRFFESGFLQG